MPHDSRDQLVDFVRVWSDKTEIPVCRFLPWIGIGSSKFHDWKHRFGKVNEHNAWIPRDHWLTDDEKDRICISLPRINWRIETRRSMIRATANWPRLGSGARYNASPQTQHQQAECQPVVTPAPAIDFAAIRALVTMAAVLQLLGFRANSSRGGQQRGPCPLHGSTSGTSRCFSANLDEQVFHCFKCGCGGNALDLWAKAKQLSLYDAAVDLCERLGIAVPLCSARNKEEERVAPDK